MPRVYPHLRDLLRAGYAISMVPIDGSDYVRFIISRDGDAAEQDVSGFEWMFAEEGMADVIQRLVEFKGIPTT